MAYSNNNVYDWNGYKYNLLPKGRQALEKVQEIAGKYGLTESSYWPLVNGGDKNKRGYNADPKDNGNVIGVILTHAAISLIGDIEHIIIDSLDIVESNGPDNRIVMKATGHRFEHAQLPNGTKYVKTEIAYGECSSKNSSINYPVAICEKRAKDRLIMKLSGLSSYGLMSEAESEEFTNLYSSVEAGTSAGLKGSPPAPKANPSEANKITSGTITTQPVVKPPSEAPAQNTAEPTKKFGFGRNAQPKEEPKAETPVVEAEVSPTPTSEPSLPLITKPKISAIRATISIAERKANTTIDLPALLQENFGKTVLESLTVEEGERLRLIINNMARG